MLCRPALPQVVVEKSKDKVIISGTPYYVHVVKKGETPYSISKAYGVTVEDINRENPPALYGIREGQVLRIPIIESPAPTQVRPAVTSRRDETKFIYHRLQPGDTVYHLSKLYGVSENDIIASNPGVDISRLPVNSEIAVPRKEFMTERQEFAVQDSDYIFHKVLRGESLTSIAAQYGLSVKDLRKENRNVRFPQVGDYMRIPVPKKPPVETAENRPATDTSKVAAIQPPLMLTRAPGFTPVRSLKGSFNVAVMLPFFLNENARRTDIDSSGMLKGKRVYKVISRSDEWIYPGSMGFLEMYQGILLAADTLRSLGMNIIMHAFDISADTVELTRLINNGSLDDMDLIIGPVYSHNLAIMTAYAGSRRIPVVSPVPLFSNSALNSNPNLFMANASLEVAQNRLAKKIGDYFDNNIVFIHADTSGIDQDVKNFKEKIFSELSNRLPYGEIKFKEFTFYSRSAFGNDSINRLSHALSKDVDNTIIIASEDTPVMIETIQEIHSLSRKFNVKVFGYPAIRTLDNLDPKYLFELDMLVYSPFWIDYSRKDVLQFSSDFRQKFQTEPAEASYAWLGYDITYYFLSGIALHGKEFIAHPEIHNPDLLHTQFDFRRKTNDDGFEDCMLYPVRFTKDYQVILEKETDTGQ